MKDGMFVHISVNGLFKIRYCDLPNINLRGGIHDRELRTNIPDAMKVSLF